MGVLDKFLDAIKLNEDYDDDEFFDEEDMDEYEEKPRKRFFKKIESQDEDDEYEEINTFKKSSSKSSDKAAKQTKVTKQPKKSNPKITPMRSPKKQGGNMEVVVVKPVSMEDTREVIDALLDQCTVVLNLESNDVEVAQRIIDFTSGACYSLNGNLQKISSFIFILTPATVDISGDYQEILSGAFELPPIRTEF